jgi:copper chaperone
MRSSTQIKELGMTHKEISIQGMNCSHCVMAVRRELMKIAGLRVHDVTIGSASVEYDEARVTQERIRAAVEEAGFVLTR